MYELIDPRPAEVKRLDGQEIEIPAPELRPEPGKSGMLQRIMPMFSILIMVGMIGMLVVSSGGLTNMQPTAFMMPMMMLPMLLTTTLSSVAGPALTEKIDNFYLKLREVRKLVHLRGKAMFEAQREVFPAPPVLAQLTGHNEREYAAMWTIDADAKGLQATEGIPDGVTFNPYMAARIGLATVVLQPPLKIIDQQVTENLEPVTGVAWRKFVRAQRFVPGFPVAVDLSNAGRYIIDADKDEAALALCRSMIASLAFNHSPDTLRLALVTDDPDSHAWRDFKWLPHTLAEDDGSRLHIYRTLTDFMAGTTALRRHRGGYVPGPAGKALEGPRMVVIVDLPQGVQMPAELSTRGVGGFTFLIARGGLDMGGPAADSGDVLFLDDGNISFTPDTADQVVHADALSEAEFGVFARTMTRYRPVGFGDDDGERTSVAKSAVSWLEALGIDDIDLFDPRVGWAENDRRQDLSFVLGNVLDEKTGEPTGAVQTLNIAEAWAGGTGPIGVLQGITGAGKSILLRLAVLSLCLRYSPERVNFILWDFKGGATFLDFDRLPHVLANITNLAREAELLSRAQDAIEGEVVRRQQVFRDAGVENIRDYNKKREQHPEMPAMPHLFIIADEFTEFMAKEKEFRGMFESLARIIRSIGGELLLCSQAIDYSVIGNMQDNVTYGMSLKVAKGAHSTQVIGNPAAASLTNGTGDAYLKMVVEDGSSQVFKFRGFNILEPYRPPSSARVPAGAEGRLHALSASEINSAGDDSVISVFASCDDDAARVAARDEEGQAGQPAAADTASAAEDDHRETVRDRLFNRLLDFADIQAPHQIWLPTLVPPITLTDVGPGQDRSTRAGLWIPVGLIDDPRNHRQYQYELMLDGPTAHLHVLGERGTGRTTTLQTIVVSAADRYAPQDVSFFLVDYGVKLGEIRDFPNVSGYGHSSNPEMVDRLLGEVARMLNIRESRFAHYDATSWEQYLTRKRAADDTLDPYGRMVLVIDNARDFIGLDERDESRVARLELLLSRGASVGIHVVVSSTGQIFHKLDGQFNAFIHHHLRDVSNGSVSYGPHETRAAARTIPSQTPTPDGTFVTQPGRVMELSSVLHARIALPIYGKIEPAAVTNDGEFYDYDVDYSAEIAARAAELAATVEPAPPVRTVPPVVPVEAVMSLQQHNLQAGRMDIPLGLNTADLTLAGLPDTRFSNAAPHLMVAGDSGSGKTTVLRFLLRYISAAYPAGRAVVYLIDPLMSLVYEQQCLRELGLLAGYVGSSRPADIAPVANQVRQILAQRTPSGDLTAQQMRDRSWYDGPDVFVVVDNMHTVGAGEFGMSGPLDDLTSELAVRPDRRVHMYVTSSAGTFPDDLGTRRSYRNLKESQPTTLLLSGASNAVVFGTPAGGGQIRFARRRPGQGQLHNIRWADAPVIQTPNDATWEDTQ